MVGVEGSRIERRGGENSGVEVVNDILNRIEVVSLESLELVDG